MLHDDSLVEMVEASNTPLVDPDGDITMLAGDRGSTAESGAGGAIPNSLKDELEGA